MEDKDTFVCALCEREEDASEAVWNEEFRAHVCEDCDQAREVTRYQPALVGGFNLDTGEPVPPRVVMQPHPQGEYIRYDRK